MSVASIGSCARPQASGWAAFGGPVWAWVGVVPLATAAIGFCPLYPLVGLNTCPAKG